MALLFGREDRGEEGVVGGGSREGAGAVGGDVDFEEDEGLDVWVGEEGGERGEERDLGGVVEKEGEGGGPEGGGDGGEAGEDGGVEGEGVEDVCGTGLVDEGEEEGGYVFGFEEGRDDYVGRGVWVQADLELGKFCCLCWRPWVSIRSSILLILLHDA